MPPQDWKALAEASHIWWGEQAELDAMVASDAIWARGDPRPQPPPPERVDVIRDRMTARGAAPSGTAADFMARFIGD